MTRFAFYGRLSTTDKQDPALSFPSQLKACERKVGELGGTIACEFTDQESGAKQDRPGWTALTNEARDTESRRFDAVVIYATSRLARDRLYAALFERELQKVGVAIHYATGAGDPTTPEGKVFIGMQQLWDEFERNKLSRETKRGMREAAEQGFRTGGRAPYGYRRVLSPLPEGHRGDRDKHRVTLEPDPDEAPVVAEIFHAFVGERLSLRAGADRLNAPGRPPPPRHVDTARNLRRHWAATTIRSMLANPVYTGRTVWNRLDFATGRQNGGGARRRAREEWVIAEDTHLPLIAEELFAAAQERLDSRERAPSEQARRIYLFAGMVRCASGHQPLSMQGKSRKGHAYYACGYAQTYGNEAAEQAHDGQKWIYLREDALLPLVERFLCQRIFGPMRLEKLASQLKSHRRKEHRNGRLTATRIRQQLSDLDRRLKLQVRALEDGVEADLVSTRITELRADREALEAALAEIGSERESAEDDLLGDRLKRLPDLSQAFRDAPREVKRQTLEAFDVEIAYDRPGKRIEIPRRSARLWRAPSRTRKPSVRRALTSPLKT